MNFSIKNYNELTIDQIKQLKKLTLNHWSGMTYELNNFEKISKTRIVNARIIIVEDNDKIIAWALLSKENSDFAFDKRYHPSTERLFQVYVSRDFRRQGIGSQLLKLARKKAYPYKLHVSTWDTVSESFYKKFRLH